MIILIFGGYFLVQALCHWLGFSWFVPRRHRFCPLLKEYQKGLVFPYGFLGIGWIILGLLTLCFPYEPMNVSLCMVAIALLPIVLIFRLEQKYKINS